MRRHVMRHAAWIWFLLGFGGLMFSRAGHLLPTIPVAILIAPVFILRFSRTRPGWRGTVGVVVGFLLSMNIALWALLDTGEVATTIAVNVVRSSMIALVYAVPFLVDRLVAAHFPGLAATLVLPTATVAVFFLAGLDGPLEGGGAWTVYVHALGHRPLLQVASVVGLWGLVFLGAWAPALVNHAWQSGFARPQLGQALAAGVVVLLAVYAFGITAIRSFDRSGAPTVTVAAVVLRPDDAAGRTTPDIKNRILSPVEESLAAIADRTRTAAAHGARIVAFQEYTMALDERDEPGLTDRLGRIARDSGVYLSVTYAMIPREGKGRNTQVLFDPAGTLVIEHVKRYLLGFADLGEAGVFDKGDGVLHAVDTPYGRLGVATCRELGVTRHMRQAAELGVDIVVNPSSDWPRSTAPLHELQSVNYGFSILRPVSNGYSYAVDPTGKLLAHLQTDHSTGGIMYARLPIEGRTTAYGRFGDLFAWSAVLGVAVLIGWEAVARTRRRETARSG
jgi:apolipoprotein N-acyltransferase